jgi:hypothetical protein
VDAPSTAEVTGNNEAFFSNTAGLVSGIGSPIAANYATLEHNLWVLDGTRRIMPDEAPFEQPGYVSTVESDCSVVVTFPEVRQEPIRGITIDWSNDFGEYATRFRVDARLAGTTVASYTENSNKSVRSVVEYSMSEYDSLVVTPLEWSMPRRRRRIDMVFMGTILSFDKNNILSYTHEQTGDITSGSLPKNEIRFSLSNFDGMWNPSNALGYERYLAERQEVVVRYGLDVGGVVEWIPAGRFYLSGWTAPESGFEASFTARDVLEYMLNEEYIPSEEYGPSGEGLYYGYQIVDDVVSKLDLPKDFKIVIDSNVQGVDCMTGPPSGYTAAEMLQIIGNMGRSVFWQDRSGVLNLRALDDKISDYTIRQSLSYAHPNVEWAKPMKAISVSYGEESKYVYPCGRTGETQTVNNPFVENEEEARVLAEWIQKMIGSRQTVSGEFRADPRLDVFDVVSIESKYGEITPVVIESIRYEYTGSFRGTYSGRVVTGMAAVLGTFQLDYATLS